MRASIMIVQTVAVTLIIAGASTAGWAGPYPCNPPHCFKEKLPPGGDSPWAPEFGARTGPGGVTIDDPAQPQDRTGSGNSVTQPFTGGPPQGGTTGVSPRPKIFVATRWQALGKTPLGEAPSWLDACLVEELHRGDRPRVCGESLGPISPDT
jgi:hypothetical protein